MPASRYLPRVRPGKQPSEPKRGSVLWRALKKGMPMFLGRRRHSHQPRQPRFLVHPDTRLKGAWDLLLAGCVFYTTCVVPYRVCFQREAEGGFALLEGSMDVAFFVDILLNFLTGVRLASGDVCFEWRVIARAYLRGWFVIDLLSTVPFDKIAKLADVGGGGGGGGSSAALLSTKLLRGLKVMRLVKLARLRRLGRLMSRLEDAVYTNQSLLELVKLAFIMLFIAHLVACVWFAVGLLGDAKTGTWITRVRYDDASLPNLALLQYVGSMYWAIVTMTTIGYGDIVGFTNAERLVNVAVMALGASFFGYIVGTISSLVTNLDVAAARYEEHMTTIKEYVHSRSMPKHLSARVRDHFEYYYQNSSVFNERKILCRLPSALRNEMIHHGYAKSVTSIKYFEKCHESLVSDMVMAMEPFSVLKDEFVFVQHEIAAHVFFLVKGKVSLVKTLAGSGDERRLSSLSIGDHFGEMEVYDHQHGNGIRICSAVAKSYCELTFLSRKAIAKISDNWPEVLRHFRASALSSSAAMKRRMLISEPTAIGAIGVSSSTPHPAAVSAGTKAASAAYKEEEEMVAAIQKSSAMATKIMRENNRKQRVVPVVDVNGDGSAAAKASEPPGSAPESLVADQQSSPAPPTLTPVSTLHSPLRGKKVTLEALPSSPTFAKVLAADDGIQISALHDAQGESRPIGGNQVKSIELLSTAEAPAALHNGSDSVVVPGAGVLTTNGQSIPTPIARCQSETRLDATQQEVTGASETEGEMEQEQLSHMIAKIRDSAVSRPVPSAQQERKQLKGTRVLHPQEPFILTWQFIIGIGILYSIIVVPLRLGFDYDASGTWYVLEMVIDGFFLVDIALNFRTAFFNDERLLVSSPRAIFWRYAKGWFLVDLVSTLPIDELVRGIVGGGAGGQAVHLFPTKLLRLLRVIRLLKLVRLIKLSRVFGRVRNTIQLSPSMERLLKLLSIMTIFCHWNACLFHAVMLGSEGDKLENWCLETYFRDQPEFSECSSRVPLVDRYVASLYWAFTTLTTVGYGDVKPSIYSVYELSMVIILIVVDATMFGYILSAVISLIRNLDPTDREYRLLMNEMKDYLRDSTASSRLCANVKTQYQHNIACTSLFPEQKIFDKMCPSLRYDLGRLVAGESLFAIPLITVMEDSFKGFVSFALFLLKPLSIRRGEKVCRSGGPGSEMFFLVEGECDLLNSKTGVGRIIAENAVFEQYALMACPDEIYRTVSTVTALSPRCILYSLSIHDFKRLEEVSPAVSTYFLSQLASVLMEDGMFTLSPTQKVTVQNVLRQGQHFRAVAEKTNHRPLLKDLGHVAMAQLHIRRGSEWSPDLLPKQLQLLEETGGCAAESKIDGSDGESEDGQDAAPAAATAAMSVVARVFSAPAPASVPALGREPESSAARRLSTTAERLLSTTFSDPEERATLGVRSVHGEDAPAVPDR